MEKINDLSEQKINTSEPTSTEKTYEEAFSELRKFILKTREDEQSSGPSEHSK